MEISNDVQNVVDIFVTIGSNEYYAIGLTTTQCAEKVQQVFDDYFSSFVNLYYSLYQNDPNYYEDFLLESTSHFTLPTCKVFNTVYKKLKLLNDDTRNYQIVVRPSVVRYSTAVEFTSNLRH